MKEKSILTLVLILSLGLAKAQDQLSLKSPDGLTHVSLELRAGKPVYSVMYRDKVFLRESPLGLVTSAGDFSSGLSFLSAQRREISEDYTIDRAKVSRVHYQANELTCRYLNAAKDSVNIVFRLSNNNVAFSYRLNTTGKTSGCEVRREESGFRLPEYASTFISPQALPMTGWERTKPSYEEEYTFNEPVGRPSKYGVGYTFPALFKLGNDGWMLLSETGVNSGYVGARLGEGSGDGLYMLEFPQEGENNGRGPTSAAGAFPLTTPWRTITLGSNLKPIVESTIAFDLVKPQYEAKYAYKAGRATWSWIVWQDNSVNYADQVKFIDLAAALNFEYVLVDGLWDTQIGRDRIAGLVNYARSKKVGVILWYNSNGYWNNAPQTPQDRMNTAPARKREMAWLQKIGVKGLKVDFFGGDKQETMKLYEDILSDANEHDLVITFHGCTLPRGWERMYPNFVTAEAVLASENLVFQQKALDGHAHAATILPFTRNTVASMDFGPVFLNQRLSKDQKGGTLRHTTDAFELSTAVLYFSAVQHFALTPNNLNEQPAYVLDFLRGCPAAWDETVYIDGAPGEHCVLARRKSDKWYVAAVNGQKQKRNLSIYVPMLAGKEVNMLYDKNDRKAGIKTLKIDKSGRVKLELLDEGGAVLFSK